jgi:NAD(P)-dependent dehydrogenase (short-subunit alcohol dehydrogenase family)
MSYELEPFGIKVILIEPGFVKTNFQQAMIRLQDPNSPYSQLMQKRAAVSSQSFQSGSAPELVAKVVLTAINTLNPNLRYLVGKDVEEWIKSKDSMTDAEFHNMMAKDMSD